MWQSNKRKWAKRDSGTYYYWYRRKWNIPRVPFEKTDDLTEYDFEYEFLLEQAFNKRIEELMNNQKINTGDGGFERNFQMDEEELEHILDLNDRGEFIDFEIPPDAPEGKRMSENVLGTDEQTASGLNDQVPVDLKELFGGGSSGR